MTNIVMIALDDLFNVTKYRTAFGVSIETPNIDRLADMGVTFDNAYASIAVCNASRTSVMAGQSPFKTGIHLQGPEQWSDVMAAEDTLVGVMRSAGFETYGSGKTYHNQTQLPAFESFDSIYDHHFQSTAAQNVGPGQVAAAQTPGSPIKDDENVAWAVDELAANNGDDPFFLTVGIIRPHRPFVIPQEYLDLYPQSQIVLPSEVETTADLADVSPFYKQFRLLDNYDTNLQNNGLDKEFAQGYLASITYADAQIGLLLDAIENNASIASDTAIMLWSDHGYHLGSRDTWNKFTLWEEAANTPLMIAAPGIFGGTRVDAPVSLLDIFPTILDLGGVTPPSGWDLDGRSLTPLLSDSSAPGWVDSVAISTMVGSLSIRTNDHRLVFYNDASLELYDLVADPGQITNLAVDPAYQSLIDQLTTRLVTEVAAQGAIFDPDALTLIGTSSADLFFVAGAQVAEGGDGDDYYFISDGAEVTETAGAGEDTIVFADFDFTIPAHVEHVRNSVYSNNFPFNVTGNAQDNDIYIYQARGNVAAGEGNDTVNTFRSRDSVDGGDGDDLLRTLSGTQNTLKGGAGDDTIFGGDRTDEIIGDGVMTPLSGDDIIVGDYVFETDAGAFVANRHLILEPGGVILSISGDIDLSGYLMGELRAPQLSDFDALGHDDTISAGAGNDIVMGQAGHDSIDGGLGDDTLFGNDGGDTIEGRSGNDSLIGGAGADRLTGHSGNDSLNGGTGMDVLSGGAGDDTIIGGTGDDMISGDGGADLVNAGGGADTVNGGSGEDTISGASGNDQIFGQGDADEILAGLGDDLISGGGGADTLLGQGGLDTLLGDAGNDILVGGGGADRFVFQVAWGHDTITDFANDGQERIDFSGIAGISGLASISISQNGSDAVITYASYSITLNSIFAPQLSDSDFIWA